MQIFLIFFILGKILKKELFYEFKIDGPRLDRRQ